MRKMLIAGLSLISLVAAPSAVAKPADANHDRIPDRWERAYHLSLKVDQSRRDPDHDGLGNLSEYRDATNPRRKDTDHDGVLDGREDADHDGVSNAREQRTERAGPPAPASEPARDPAPQKPAAPAAPAVQSADGAATVVSYTQGAGFGGTLVIQRANGERVSSFFGEKTDLECQSGASVAPCTKDHLVAGTPVVVAEHGPNAYGNDVWTRVTLGAATVAPSPAPSPAPAPAPAPTGTPSVVSYTQGAGFGGTLVIQRANGERVSSFFGEKTDLECQSGASVAPCTKDHLVAGTPVVVVEHGPNAYGNDVWTRVTLVLGT